MSDYRIYMTEPDGRIRTGEDFSCKTDEQARARAISLMGRYHRVEVWFGVRRVCVETIAQESGG